ncbi:MAG: UDP-N-acetylmuramoyl-L-alanyl-D-glutamate--2,6-diaminopimelate ligase [Candidatus Bipolaricaulota bacterium]|nr:UDP-N-acetylmuramoyl-L-alanyl-D-glutamate--2,6-diaminopimelate ligase [Candidatus Bipolaricaulota bacterium]MCS7273817.1 UDP-N-acetylmuramoyl-L-alanyl-D-glutamate--2,6-diaminopimelate ligase [Candidatus Bipolaricaulota bacterium]MDW8110765.1 UDP-N-acetylmuramoyl-L-alanyl-D-glutamate--2,6-diaminopimelate ligase [Candidatus Bipolaricaulota bacterium]MDW8328377.1 UDP-N-acetylmuramoyl-L-alanyl-D-glutamate--2,6-diaminopimelate ligase [Candidatus Bipolaricaulota bacterium]
MSTLSISLTSLLRHLCHQGVRGDLSVTISQIAEDSRRVCPGALFVAIPGTHHDGHRYIQAAISSGAVAVVGERADLDVPVTYILVENSRQALAEAAAAFYRFPTERLFTVGVTGTNGKTSTTTLAAAVLGESQTALSNTVRNALERHCDLTTPSAIELQRLAYEALTSGKQHFVIEVSAHALSQYRVHAIDFDVGVFTNLTHDHLDYYGSMERYLQAKLLLFQYLRPSATAIINGDDPYATHFIRATHARVLTYGLGAHHDLWADEIVLHPTGSRFTVHTPAGLLPIETLLPGEFSVYNILAAIAVGLVRGRSLEQIKQGIESVRAVPGRCERYTTRDGVHIVVDFAHSPDALERVLKMLKRFYPRVICVFGCGGESDPYKRPIMGEISGRYADYTIITSDNPKREDPLAIIAQIEFGIRPLQAAYEAIADRPQAILRALALARAGDCVLIAGKGHERTQIFADREIPYNDSDFLRERGIISQSPSSYARISSR